MTRILLLLLAPAAILALTLWPSVAIVPLWRWYVVPVTGWPELGYAHAAGLAIVVCLLRPMPISAVADNRSDKEKWRAFGMTLLAPLIALGVGWALLAVAR